MRSLRIFQAINSSKPSTLPSHQLFQAINSSVISAHLISRALDRRMILDDIAKETFRELLALLPD
jgi:ADP-ribosylglycohydrolase